ncbi:MAG TPA: hypothetical protein VGM90_32830 [Kofleriaceae bacterium]|jgi:DNA anti-recombination protein RmuC
MSKPDTSALEQAAAVFAEELASYSRLGELFIKTPLSSVKHLERANQTLSEIANAEGKLQAAGQDLVKVLAAARQQQETLAKGVVDHVPMLQKRNEKLRELMGELTSVAGEVSGLNAAIQHRGGNGDATAPAAAPTAEDARDVSATALALADRAEQLAKAANEAEFEELATQAHSLHQRLQAIGKKLAKAGGA